VALPSIGLFGEGIAVVQSFLFLRQPEIREHHDSRGAQFPFVKNEHDTAGAFQRETKERCEADERRQVAKNQLG